MGSQLIYPKFLEASRFHDNQWWKKNDVICRNLSYWDFYINHLIAFFTDGLYANELNRGDHFK